MQNGSMLWGMVLELKSGSREVAVKDTGNTIKWMDMETLLIFMVIFMMGNSRMIHLTGMKNILVKMYISTRVNGIKEKSMVRWKEIWEDR